VIATQLSKNLIRVGVIGFFLGMGLFTLAAQAESENREPARSLQIPYGNFYGKVVQSFEIKGLKRIEKDAVVAKIGTKLAHPVNREQIKDDIKALFSMGYFDDIQVEGEILPSGQVKLIYSFRERPVISKIEFEGNEKIGTNDLKDVIKIKEWSILDVNKVREDVARIQKHYEEKGFYLAKVNFAIEPVDDDQVKLIYRINDYDKVQIKKITFLNNRKFSDQQLKGLLAETREGGSLSFLTSSGSFKEAAFKQDLQRLNYWYLDHGYVKFRYENPVVTVSDDKKWLYISIYVDEGDQYKIGTIDFGGDLLFSKEELEKDITLTSGELFSVSKRNTDIQRLTEKYQDLGYAFANVIPKMNIHEDTLTIDTEYDFEKGNLVHFGEINILGNTKTHDKVIRRELKIHEGELYSGTKMRESRENVERLGFFAPGEILFNTVTPKDRPDVLDVDITVKERSTGTITLGAGVGSVQGVFFTSTISEINLFGRGQNLSLSAQYSSGAGSSRSFNLGFTDPYAFDTLWSMGGDLYSVILPIPNRYNTRKLGGDARLGYPIGEFTRLFFTYKNEGLQIFDKQSTNITDEMIRQDSGVLSSVVVNVVRDVRNNRFETTAGNYQSASVEFAGLGGDKYFLKWNLNNRFYRRVIGDLVFRNSVEVGQITGMENHPIPPSEKFYLGGPNNMKGYDYLSLGPSMIGSNGVRVPLGGGFQAFSLFELEYPLIRDAGLKFVTFFDAGNSWERIPVGGDPLVIRTDAGFGFRWFSPIGPLRFEWGYPLSKRPGESSPVFQFFIGAPF